MKTLRYMFLILALGACGEQSPQVKAPTINDLAGQWIVVNYWAQWCKPCIEEIPELNEFAGYRSDVAVVGVNFEGATGADLASQEQKLGVEFPTIPDPSATLGIARPAVLPTTLLIDPRGVVVSQMVGPQNAESLAQAISRAAADSGG